MLSSRCDSCSICMYAVWYEIPTFSHDAPVLNCAQMLLAAGFQTTVEPRNEFVLIDNSHKHTDLKVDNFKGRPTGFDVSIIHPIANTFWMTVCPGSR